MGWLAHLGPLGLFSVAVIDSSGIPLLIPGSTDLLLLWMVSYKGNPWLMATCTVFGSLLGGYITWSAGSRGREAALRHYGPARHFGSFIAWAKRHTVLSIFLPALLPPPVLVGPFVFVSGAIGVSRRRFLAVYGASRSLRYGLVAWLGVVYGRSVMRLWSTMIQKWSVPLICIFAGVLVCGASLAIWQLLRQRNSKSQEDRTVETGSAHAR